MANELEQFVESNKQRLTEVNASNPQLYSAISMALDYLNKQYFGGTTELKVDIPQPTPVTPVQITQTDSVDRIFTDEELIKLSMDNVWTFLNFKETKIELTNDVQQQNFLNYVKLLLGGMDTYLTRYAGNYFYTDESLIIYNDNNESGFNKSTYQLLYYNQIFADLLKSKPTATKLLSVWDSVYAYSSKDYATPIDYNFLQKAVYSNRRSKDMKLEIARAFGEIKSIYRSATNWADVERDYGQSSSQSICKYELNNEVYEIIGNFGYKSFNDVTQYTDLQIKDWIADLIFSDFEYPLNDDRVKEKLLEWYRNQVNKPTAQPNTPTPQDPNLQNAKFKVGDKVKITNIGNRYSTFKEMFKKMGFANQLKNDEGSNGDVGTIFAVGTNPRGEIIYGVLVELGATRKYQTLISERGLELFQPTPLSASKFEVGDWVRLVDNDRLVGIDIGAIGLVTKFGSDNDPKIEWQEYKLVSENGTYVANRFELALKNPKPIFKIGDLVRWKEDVYNYNVKKGAYASVVGFGVFDGNILANVEWVDTKTNKAKVGGQSNGGYNEDFFELALSNKEIEQTTNDFIKKITTKTPLPEETTIVTTSEDKDEEDFEDLADELENLDF